MHTGKKIITAHKTAKAQNNKAVVVSETTDHAVREDHDRCSEKVRKFLKVRAYWRRRAALTTVLLNVILPRPVTMHINYNKLRQQLVKLHRQLFSQHRALCRRP